MKNNLRRFLRSLLAIAVSFFFLIGSTFAWFTDSETLGVNTVQSGTLQIELLDGEGPDATSLEGKSLAFLCADNRDDDAVLWEPGARYMLQSAWIYNAGNLHASYQIALNSPVDTTLAEALNVYVDGQMIGTLLEVFHNQGILTYGTVAPDAYQSIGVLELEMNTLADNRYQGLSLRDLAITVNATQAPVEYDSFNNTYDRHTDLPIGGTYVANEAELWDALYDGDTVIVLKNDIEITSAYTIAENSDVAIYGVGNKISHADGHTGNLFTVPETSTLTLNCVVIDGGAEGFAVDMSGYPSIVADSLANITRTTAPALVSYGELVAVNSTFANNYSNGYNGSVHILSGTAEFDGCDFSHNYSPKQGAAVNVGVDSSTVTEYAVKEVVFRNCTFDGNITDQGGSGGGALYIVNTELVRILSCDFLNNCSMSYNCGGGAVFFGRNGAYAIMNSDYDLPFVQAYIDDCLFDNNHSGNDGFAVNNESADLYITNSTFINNYGHAGNSSVGTVSCMSYAGEDGHWYKLYMDNCVMNGNNGAAALIGDHGTLLDLRLTNCAMNANIGDIGILMYTGDAVIEDCSFADNAFTSAVLDCRSYMTDEMYNPEMTVKNLEIIGTDEGVGILVRKQSSDLSRTEASVTVEGMTTASVRVEDGTFLTISGTLNGDITLDSTTEESHVVINGVHNGSIVAE